MEAKEKVLDFAKNLFHNYLENQDFAGLMNLLDQNIFWIGPGKNEIGKNYSDAFNLLAKEKNIWSGRFKILDQWYECLPLNDTYFLVYGAVKAEEAGVGDFGVEFRQTLVCKVTSNDEIKIVHSHVSLPSSGLINQSEIEAYNHRLEVALNQHSQLLQNRNSQFQLVMSSIHCGIEICRMDDDFTIVYVNDGFCNLVGYTRSEIKTLFNNKHLNLVMPEARQFVKESIATQLSLGDTYAIEYNLICKDGRHIWVIEKGKIVVEKDGSELLQCIFVDMSEQKQLTEELAIKHEELKISEKRYEIALANSNILIFDYIINSRTLISTEKTAQRFNFAEVIPNAPSYLIETGRIHENSINIFKDAFNRIDQGEQEVSCVITILTEDDFEVNCRMIISNIFDDLGKPIRAIGVLQDITNEKILEREKRYREAISSACLLSYEVNLSKDVFIEGGEYWQEYFQCDTNSYSQIMALVAEKLVYQEDKERFEKFARIDNILAEFSNGITQSSIEYRRIDESGKYFWVSSTLNLIKDPSTGDVKLWTYSNNVDVQKQKEMNSLKEQRYYQTMLPNSTIFYEFNLSKDLIVQGSEDLIGLGLQNMVKYSDLVKQCLLKIVHREDHEVFKEHLWLSNMLNCYQNGSNKFSVEYRRINKDGDMVWVSNNVQFFLDDKTGDIKAYCYVQDINDEKLKQLDLIYKAEHDALTGIYNKATTEYIIDKYLQSDEGFDGKHAFFMFDIDYFKPINDNFGHAFGDVILSQVAGKVRALFREDDIFGRIGGDEFVILMKNVSDTASVVLKAQQICENLRESYMQKGKEFRISASVGIAFYDEHAKNYLDLYKSSDTALYVAKQNGRNQFTIYSKNMSSDYSAIKNIETNTMLESKSFENNVGDYVFRILYESADKEAAINTVLSLIGKHFQVSRSYIFEDSDDGKYTRNTFEWCNKGIEPAIDSLQQLSYETEVINYKDNFAEGGIYHMPDINLATKDVQAVLRPQNVFSLLQFAIERNGEFKGFIGFDYCIKDNTFSKKAVTELKNIANILGVFLLDMRTYNSSNVNKSIALSIINGLDSYAYVVDGETKKLLFINKKTYSLVPNVKVGDYCYKAFWRINQPCDFCPIANLNGDRDSKYSIDVHNPNYDVWTKATASWVEWTDVENACLIESVDITTYKKELAQCLAEKEACASIIKKNKQKHKDSILKASEKNKEAAKKNIKKDANSKLSKDTKLNA